MGGGGRSKFQNLNNESPNFEYDYTCTQLYIFEQLSIQNSFVCLELTLETIFIGIGGGYKLTYFYSTFYVLFECYAAANTSLNLSKFLNRNF